MTTAKKTEKTTEVEVEAFFEPSFDDQQLARKKAKEQKTVAHVVLGDRVAPTAKSKK